MYQTGFFIFLAIAQTMGLGINIAKIGEPRIGRHGISDIIITSIMMVLIAIALYQRLGS